VSESSAPFNCRGAGRADVFFLFEPEFLRAAIRFAGLGEAFRFAFAFFGGFGLAGFFGDGLAPRRACFLE
jgi:hypothetical protein